MIQFAVDKDFSFSDELFNNGKIIKVVQGDVLHNEHHHCSALGKVLRGKLHLSRLLSSGREIIIKEFGPGEFFAELIVFNGDKFPGWLIASEDSEVIEVERSKVLEYLKDQESLISFITGVSRKMNHLTNKIEILSLKTVQQKVAYCLLVDGRLSISSITRTATQLGCSREALSRAVSELEQAKAVLRIGGRLIPKDTTYLESLF